MNRWYFYDTTIKFLKSNKQSVPSLQSTTTKAAHAKHKTDIKNVIKWPSCANIEAMGGDDSL